MKNDKTNNPHKKKHDPDRSFLYNKKDETPKEAPKEESKSTEKKEEEKK